MECNLQLRSGDEILRGNFIHDLRVPPALPTYKVQLNSRASPHPHPSIRLTPVKPETHGLQR